MGDRVKKMLDRIREIWKSWTAKQRTMIISAAAVVAVAVAIVVFVLNQPNYKVLTTCEDYSEMNSVTSVLTDNSIKYKINDNTMVVYVKKADLTRAKMIIASEDIQPDGYTFDDAMKSSFSTTTSDKLKQYAHYLESKFVSDLESMDGIKSATVTVSIPESSSSFYEQTSETSVAVTLDTTKSVDDETAESIANFLATAVGNKTTESISIISVDGSTLFSGMSNSSGNSGMSYAGKLKYKVRIENTVVTSMKNSLLATGIYDDMYVNLNYDLDWDAVNIIATEYSTQGDEQAIYGKSYEEISSGATGASGTPGTTSNDDTTYEVTDGYGNTSQLEIRDYTYMPNEIVTTTYKEPGSIIYDTSTLAVTFIKYIKYNEDECKKLGYLDDMTWEEFRSQNSQPVATTVDNAWLEILSKSTGVAIDNISVLAYERPYFESAETSSILKNASFWLQIALAGVILILLAIVVVRSARPLTVEEKEPELSVEEMLASTRGNQPAVEDIDMNDKSDTRKAIEKFVDENPEAVALLLRNWLNDGWE